MWAEGLFFRRHRYGKHALYPQSLWRALCCKTFVLIAPPSVVAQIVTHAAVPPQSVNPSIQNVFDLSVFSFTTVPHLTTCELEQIMQFVPHGTTIAKANPERCATKGVPALVLQTQKLIGPTKITMSVVPIRAGNTCGCHISRSGVLVIE